MKSINITLQQLEYIVALDTYRHFVKAAEHCFVTQPTLTMQVKKLEEETGVVLFNRSAKPLEPTPAGVPVIDRARAILMEVKNLEALFRSETEDISGEYSLAVIPTLAPYILPMFLMDFSSKYPQTILNIRELQSQEIIDRLKKGTLDMALLVTPLDEKELKEMPVFEEAFLFYSNSSAGEGNKVNPEEMDISNLLLLSEGHCFRSQVLNICSNPLTGQPTVHSGFHYESGSIETLKRLVDKGGGFTLVPELSVNEDEIPFTKRFVEPEPVREVSIVVNRSFPGLRLTHAIGESIRTNLPENIQKKNEGRKITWR